ncbi:MAG: FkbM family methyltransferase [Moorea sp. SIO3G5]|nr:FkbM family methyltransferase [Moorena sp. SIO3G5]
MILQKIVSKILATLCSKLLQLLNNRSTISLNREEIRNVKISFAQCGEDLLISRLMRKLNPNDGIYVDVGAFDPITISNTLMLYKAGWRGINIDLDDDKIDKFKINRPGDFSVVAAISDKEQLLRVIRYPGRATNRVVALNESESNLDSVIGEKPISKSVIKSRNLTEIIKDSPFSKMPIHYLNIDCEDHDINVLRSLNFTHYLPCVISIEAHSEQQSQEMANFLSPLNYKIESIIGHTIIFVSSHLEW